MFATERAVEPTVDLQEQLIRRAWEDEQFAELLRTNPRVAIAEATGVELPGDMDVQVHQECADTLHLVVPAKPDQTSPGEIKAWCDQNTQNRTMSEACGAHHTTDAKPCK